MYAVTHIGEMVFGLIKHNCPLDYPRQTVYILSMCNLGHMLTGARTATAVRTPFPRFSAVHAPFSQPPGLTLDRLRREGFLHVFSSWKRIATRARSLYRRGYPIPPPSNTRQPFRITLSRPSAFSIAFPRA